MERSTDSSFVYMLRAWQETGQPGEITWRFSLEDPHTRARRGFSSLDNLLAYLVEELGEDSEPEPQNATRSRS